MILSKFKTVARDELKLTEVGSILSQYNITNHGRGELFSTKFLKTRLKLGIMRLGDNKAVSLSVSRKRSTDCQKALGENSIEYTRSDFKVYPFSV